MGQYGSVANPVCVKNGACTDSDGSAEDTVCVLQWDIKLDGKAQDIQFVLGAGELQSELEAQIKHQGVGDCFTLLGERANPYPYIKESDIVVQTSRFEGKSIVLSEAKVLGKPIVATAYPTAGTTLTSKDGTKTFTIGETATTKTVLTVYKGKYIALADSIESISDHIMGIVNYFDAK